jgi:hypothetical protein
MKSIKHQKIVKKNLDSDKRHLKNIKTLTEYNNKIKKENEDKAKKKYIASYWQRKERDNYFKQKKIDNYNKELEKKDKLEEIDRKNEKQRKEIIKKINNMMKKKEEHDNERREFFRKDRQRRLNKIEKVKDNLKSIQEDEENFRMNVLDYQNQILQRALSRDHIIRLKKTNANEKTLIDQLNEEKNIPKFNKKMFKIKENSVLTLSSEQKYEVWKELKRKEAERKRKELEDKLNKV